MADQPKAIISNAVVGVLGWHIWTVFSVTGTGILLYLNLSQLWIGGQLGSNGSAANILGLLQIVVKLHELSIVASLVAIAEQCLLRDLLGGGLLLGLLGSEGALGNPFFLISTRFRLAVKFGLRSLYPTNSWKDHPAELRTLRLVILMIFCCVIVGLAGPASAVLMIPRIDWFHYSTNQYPPFARSTIPTIMIGTSTGPLDGDRFMESNVFAIPDWMVSAGFQYWKDNWAYDILDTRISPQGKTVHEFQDALSKVYMNTTGSTQRPLNGTWTGGTRITTEVRNNIHLYRGSHPQLQVHRDWIDIQSIDTTHGLDALVTCRARDQISCTSDSMPYDEPMTDDGSSYPTWCYRSVNNDDNTGEVRRSENLLMSLDFDVNNDTPRVWLTEGPRIDENPHFSDSIEVLFERWSTDGWSDLVICSFSAVLVAAVATSYGTKPAGEKVEYLNHVFRPDGTTAPPRRFLFHENWLDRAFSYDPSLWRSLAVLGVENSDQIPYTDGTEYTISNYSYPSGSMIYPDNFTYSARPGLFPLQNSFGRLGLSLTGAIDQNSNDEAFPVEAIVGGMLTYLLSRLAPSFSQYTMSYDQIPEPFRLAQPESFSYPNTYTLYRNGYGFKLSTRTGYLGVAVLISHAAVAIVASLWQLLKWRRIIRAWSTVPDYLCLGSGSASLVVTHPNTCAGVAGEAAFSGLVKVAETGDLGSPPHLEIVAVGSPRMTATIPVNMGDTKKQYGFGGAKQKTE